MIPDKAERTSWPVQLLLDELWLKTNRQIVQQLESRHLLADTSRARPIVAWQRLRGQQFTERRLTDWLGSTDLAHLHSESFLGARNYRLRTHLPTIFPDSRFKR